eukprot:101741_1
MVPILFVLSILTFSTYSTPSCSSYELYDASNPTAPRIEIHPTGVCNAADLHSGTWHESILAVCNDNDQVEIHHFNNFDCSGVPSSIKDPCFFEEYELYGEYEECAYESYCHLPLCSSYHSIQMWEGVTQCNGDEVASGAYVNYAFLALLFNEDPCVPLSWKGLNVSVAIECDVDRLEVDVWVADNCTGTPAMSFPVIEKACSVTDIGAIHITCDVAHSATNHPPVVSTTSCAALDVDYFLGHCSSLWEPLPKISTANFDDASSCPALAVDKFLSECSDEWRDATTIVNANADGMSKLSQFDSTLTMNEGELEAASCEALEIDEFLKECSDIYRYIDEKFAKLSNPQDAQTLGVFDTFGLDDHTILMMSFVTNFILIFVACGIVNTVRKYQRYQSYHKPVVYVESGQEDS